MSDKQIHIFSQSEKKYAYTLEKDHQNEYEMEWMKTVCLCLYKVCKRKIVVIEQ